jgi:MraZ protein
MPLFLATYLNKIDKKGRLSVPASFRATLSDQSFQGVVLFRSTRHACLEGFDYKSMESLSHRMDHFDLFSEDQDDLATAIFGDSVPCPFDGEGRIVLPDHLTAHAHLTDQAAFVGMGQKFQIWDPAALKTRQDQATAHIRDRGLTLPARTQPSKPSDQGE